MNQIQITQLRQDLGLSQVDFGRLFDSHFMTVSKWERGITSPSPYQFALMQKFRETADAKKLEAQEQVKQLLVGAGVIAALFWLLSNTK